MSILRAISTLASGTAFAQLLSICALPLVTRLYTPQDLGVIASFITLVTLPAVIACLRYETAIALPPAESTARQLLVISLIAAAVFSCLAGIILWMDQGILAGWLNTPDISGYLWLIPFGIFLSAALSAFQFLAIRNQKYLGVAQSRILQSVTNLGLQLGLGYTGYGSKGLIAAFMTSTLVGCMSLFGRFKLHAPDVTRGSLWATASAYKNFPLFSSPEALASAAGNQIPILLIAASASTSEAGFLLLASRAVSSPIQIVGMAISQVYTSRAPEQYRANTTSGFTAEILRPLATYGTGPIIFLALAAPDVFTIVFGQQWHRAGEIALWLGPLNALQLLALPISPIMNVRNLQPQTLQLMLLGCVLRIGAPLLALATLAGFMAEAYATAGAAFYAGSIFVYARAAGIPNEGILSILFRAILSMGAFALLFLAMKATIIAVLG